MPLTYYVLLRQDRSASVDRISGRRIRMNLWRKRMPKDEIDFDVSCPATVTDEFEWQLAKMGDKARNWVSMFKNWSTKRRNWNKHSHIPQVKTQNWKHIMIIFTLKVGFCVKMLWYYFSIFFFNVDTYRPNLLHTIK